MLDAIIEGLIGGLIGNALARRRERRKAALRQVKFNQGNDVRMHCSLRRPTVSTGWSHGLLRLSPTHGTWRARLNRGQPLTVSSATASYLDQHPATLSDGLLTSMPMTVVVLNHGGQRLELALLDKDVSLLLKLFRSGDG